MTHTNWVKFAAGAMAAVWLRLLPRHFAGGDADAT